MGQLVAWMLPSSPDTVAVAASQTSGAHRRTRLSKTTAGSAELTSEFAACSTTESEVSGSSSVTSGVMPCDVVRPRVLPMALRQSRRGRHQLSGCLSPRPVEASPIPDGVSPFESMQVGAPPSQPLPTSAHASSGWSDTDRQEAPVTTRLSDAEPGSLRPGDRGRVRRLRPRAGARRAGPGRRRHWASGAASTRCSSRRCGRSAYLWHSGQPRPRRRAPHERGRPWLVGGADATAHRSPSTQHPCSSRAAPLTGTPSGSRRLAVLLRLATATLPRPRQQDVGPGAHDGREGEPTQRRRDRVPSEGQPRRAPPCPARGRCDWDPRCSTPGTPSPLPACDVTSPELISTRPCKARAPSFWDR